MGMDTMRIGIVGCAGRMGRMLIKTVTATEGCALAGGSDAPGSDAQGQDLGTLAGLPALGLSVGDDPLEVFAAAHAVIDFTTPKASARHAEMAAQGQVVYVVGTTGLNAEQQGAIERAALHTPVVQAANMSLGVNVLLALVERAAAMLDDDYDIEVLEMHHRWKVDAPSGTALALGQAAAAGRGVELDKVAQRGRDGMTGARRRGDIGFAALRGGDVTGDHSVILAAEGERIEITHKAATRDIYARGAVKAAMWARGRPSGLYSMKDVLGL